MAILPFFGSSALLTSTIYFVLVFVFTVNRSRIISFIGKFLTPIIALILLAIISIALVSSQTVIGDSSFALPLVSGVLEGYQTFDAIAGVVVGAVIIISLNLRGHTSFDAKKELIRKAGIIAGTGLLLIYGGLIFAGSLYASSFAEGASRTQVLSALSSLTLDNIGTACLSVLVALACFTTAVGVVTGASDYAKELFGNSQKAYVLAALVCSVVGIVVGSFEVDIIIDVAVPALMFLYPITIVLIVLNTIPDRFASAFVFRAVVLVTFIFSIPDFLGFIITTDYLVGIKNWIPLANDNLGWVLPAILTGVLANMIHSKGQTLET